MIEQSADIFTLPPRKFAQDRARRTYRALIEAAREVFATQGFEATQTPEIAHRAGVSVGSFYRYFSDKREAFLEIMHLHLQQSHQQVLRELSPDRFIGKQRRASIEYTLSVLLDQVTRHPALERVFLAMALRDAEVADLRRKMAEASVAQLAALIGAITDPDRVPDPRATAYVVYTAATECAVHIAGFYGPPLLSRERAMDGLSTLVYRAIFGFDPVGE
jgi:AcrR family transcriptional regulator